MAKFEAKVFIVTALQKVKVAVVEGHKVKYNHLSATLSMVGALPMTVKARPFKPTPTRAA
jgi:hypothetical protein